MAARGVVPGSPCSVFRWESFVAFVIFVVEGILNHEGRPVRFWRTKGTKVCPRLLAAGT